MVLLSILKKMFKKPTHRAIPLVYITKDIERALGRIDPEYYIITTDSPLAQRIHSKFPRNVFILKNLPQGIVNTFTLLQSHETREHIEAIKNIHGTLPGIIVFINSHRLKSFAQSVGWTIINPNPEHSENIEHKIRLISWLENATDLLPPYSVGRMDNLTTQKFPFILQWGLGHTGNSTELIDSEDRWNELVKKFPEREARISKVIHGPTITVNLVTDGAQTYCGSPSYQITGLSPWTDSPWSTVGNDWALGKKLIETYGEEEFKTLIEKISMRMAKSGWYGLYGIDIIIDINAQKGERFKLIEINARQPASAIFESELTREFYTNAPNLFELHTRIFRAKLLGLNTPYEENRHSVIYLPNLYTGAQLVQRIRRVHTKINTERDITQTKYAWNIIEYSHTEYLSDSLRVQTRGNFMTDHNVLSPEGEALRGMLDRTH